MWAGWVLECMVRIGQLGTPLHANLWGRLSTAPKGVSMPSLGGMARQGRQAGSSLAEKEHDMLMAVRSSLLKHFPNAEATIHLGDWLWPSLLRSGV